MREEMRNMASTSTVVQGGVMARKQGDHQRGINNMQYSRVTKIKFPKFGGNDNEEIVRDVEKEDVDCELSEALNVVHEEDNVLYISLNALIGRNLFQTMRVIGYVGKHEIHILIDSDSTHNFLDFNTTGFRGISTWGGRVKVYGTVPVSAGVQEVLWERWGNRGKMAGNSVEGPWTWILDKLSFNYAQPEDSNELFQKLLEDLRIINKELIECNRPIFFNDNHSVQYKEYLENSSNEIATSNSNQEKEKPPQDFDICQLIKEECCIEACEEQKQNMEDTILELVEICRQKELYCMHDNVDDLIESALNFKLLSINSQRLNKEKQEVKNVVEQPAERRTRIVKSLKNFRVIHKSSISLNNTSQISSVHAVAPILSTKEPEYSPSMGYEHPNTTLKMESDEIIKSGVEELVPILSENEVTSEDKRECDVSVCENSPICDDHSEIFSDSKNDDDISSDDDAFKDIEYVEASLPDPEIESDNSLSLSNNFLPEFKTFYNHTEETRSGSTTTHVHDSLLEYDSFCFETEPDQERLINVVKNDIFDDSSNDPLLEEADLFLASDSSIPSGIENIGYDSKGDICFLEELLIDDSIPFLVNEASDFDYPSFPRPPPEPPDAEFDAELDSREAISVVINDNDELECLDPRDEIDENDDYYSFMFLNYSKVFSFLLSAESEDTIFDPGISI
nr:reverse transcriptase [Tanacetum cinerariifolium]